MATNESLMRRFIANAAMGPHRADHNALFVSCDHCKAQALLARLDAGDRCACNSFNHRGHVSGQPCSGEATCQVIGTGGEPGPQMCDACAVDALLYEADERGSHRTIRALAVAR